MAKKLLTPSEQDPSVMIKSLRENAEEGQEIIPAEIPLIGQSLTQQVVPEAPDFKVIGGVPFDVEEGVFEQYKLDKFLGEEVAKKLREICRGKPVFGLPDNPWVIHILWGLGPSLFTRVFLKSLQDKPEQGREIAGKIIAGQIPFNGQPLTEVVPGALDFLFVKNKRVMVYEKEDFGSGDVFEQLLPCCIGRPVFTPNVRVKFYTAETSWGVLSFFPVAVDDDKDFYDDEEDDQLVFGSVPPGYDGSMESVGPGTRTMTRAWAKHTIQVLAKDEILLPQILAGKLRFLGQTLGDVVKGARAKLVFEEQDFTPCMLASERGAALRDAVLGRPVFLPDEGCEFVLASKLETRSRWTCLMLREIIFNLLELADAIISGELPLKGQRLTDLPLPRLRVYRENLECPLHLLEDGWRESYENPWVRVADFPQWKPEWAVMITDEQYLQLVRDIAADVFPTVESEGGDQGPYYNGKHGYLYTLIVTRSKFGDELL